MVPPAPDGVTTRTPNVGVLPPVGHRRNDTRTPGARGENPTRRGPGGGRTIGSRERTGSGCNYFRLTCVGEDSPAPRNWGRLSWVPVISDSQAVRRSVAPKTSDSLVVPPLGLEPRTNGSKVASVPYQCVPVDPIVPAQSRFDDPESTAGTSTSQHVSRQNSRQDQRTPAARPPDSRAWRTIRCSIGGLAVAAVSSLAS